MYTLLSLPQICQHLASCVLNKILYETFISQKRADPAQFNLLHLITLKLKED